MTKIFKEITETDTSLISWERYQTLKRYISLYITKRKSGYYARVFDLDYSIYIGDSFESLEKYIEEQAAVYHL